MSKSEVRVSSPTPNAGPAEGLTIDHLRTIVQDSHLNFLIGAGTPSAYFEQLGDIENVLTDLADHPADKGERKLVRASLQGYFFEKVLLPNSPLLDHDKTAKPLLQSYMRFASCINRLLLRRRSTLLGKQADIFTTNVDLAFEVALELLEINLNDGFTGKLNPRFDPSEYGTLRIRQGTRYEYRSEVPVVNLYKIHGSVAWQQEGDEIFLDRLLSQIQDIESVFKTTKPDLLDISDHRAVNTESLLKAAEGRSLSAAGEAFVQAYERLSIVNPEKTKFASTVLNKTYYELIRRLANSLEKENSVLFVHGFSFRDEHLRDLVLRAANTNPTLQVIVFCYSRNGHEGLQTLLPDEQVKNGNIRLVIPHAPTEGEDERKMDLNTLVEDYFAPLLTEPVAAADHVIELKLKNASGDRDDE